MANPECAPLINQRGAERGGHIGRLHASIVAAVRVEIASDVVCPWCYIGKRRFERAVASLADDGVTLDLQVRHRAYLLDRHAPLDSPVPVREAYARKFGGKQHAERILADVTKVAADEGITFNMHRAIRANTMRAHRLLKIVERHALENRAIDHGATNGGAADLQVLVNESIMRAYFTEGKDISRVDTLVECAERVGFNHAALAERLSSEAPDEPSLRAVQEDLAWVAARDIAAVPTFVINDSFAVPGAQDSATFERLLKRLGPS